MREASDRGSTEHRGRVRIKGDHESQTGLSMWKWRQGISRKDASLAEVRQWVA